jgi:predicted dehydrogenase
MKPKAVVIGYGSIGKRHVKNLLSLGVDTSVLTAYPDQATGIQFVSSLDQCRDATHGIICTPTSGHDADLRKLLEQTGCRNVLIEKPLSASFPAAEKSRQIARKYSADVCVAYNMRFIKAFDLIADCVAKHSGGIRLVKIHAGQYLPEWRTYKDYRECYSAHRDQGGGVDLDLSHEIDYMLWILGAPVKTDLILKKKLSRLDIDSPDYFRGIYEYGSFIADVELDYFRKKDRKLSIIGENTNILSADFINKTLSIFDEHVGETGLFDFENGYVDELREFLGLTVRKKLCGLDEAINVLKYLGLE